MEEKDWQLVRNTCRNVNVVCFLLVLGWIFRGLMYLAETMTMAAQAGQY